MNRYEINASPRNTLAVNTSQAGMKLVGLTKGFCENFDPLSNYQTVENRRIMLIQEWKKPDDLGRRGVNVYRTEETKQTGKLFPTGNIPKDLQPVYTGTLTTSAHAIFNLVSEETLQEIAPTFIQLAFKGKSLVDEQPLLARIKEKEVYVEYDQGLMGMGNRMQTIIDDYFDNQFNFILVDEGSDTQYVFPIDVISSAENIQLPTNVPRLSKTPRPREQHGTSVDFYPQTVSAFDPAFIGSWGREDKFPKFMQAMGLVYEFGEGDNGELAFLASLGANRTRPEGQIWAEKISNFTDKEIDLQDPQKVASGGLLSDESMVNRAETLSVPFAITLANSRYMVTRREQRRALFNTLQ